MRVFEQGNGWDEHVNFVDEADTFVGFSMGTGCCEHFGWSLTRKRPTALVQGAGDIDPAGFLFDTAFCELDTPHGIDVDSGGTALFRLTKGCRVLWLLLWNSHNGYYGHGFEVKHGGTVVQKGTL